MFNELKYELGTLFLMDIIYRIRKIVHHLPS